MAKKTGRTSRNKGQRGERELAKALEQLFNCEARRGQQHHGGPGSPDVICSIPGIHWESKRCEKLQLWPALDQAIEEAGDSVPVVVHRRNERPAVVIVRLDDLPRLVALLAPHLKAPALDSVLERLSASVCAASEYPLRVD